MFIKVDHVPSLVACQVLAWGHSDPSLDDRFYTVSQTDFITKYMGSEGRLDLLGPVDCDSPAAIAAKAAQWVEQTGIEKRIFFKGSTAELAAMAAKQCLAKADMSPAQLDLIIGGTNTGPGYPSLADHIKLALGQDNEALCYDVSEACPVGAISILNGWSQIHSGACQRVLVVCAEKATTLAKVDDWRGSNLFGDAAFAVLLVAGEEESFVFFEGNSMPFEGNLGKIAKRDSGFYQSGGDVHQWVGKVAAPRLVKALEMADISPADIRHLVPHQPSSRTLDLFFRRVKRDLAGFDGICHRNVEYTGNTSGASTGSIISRQIDEGQIKSGELVVVSTFGSGLTTMNYGFRA